MGTRCSQDLTHSVLLSIHKLASTMSISIKSIKSLVPLLDRVVLQRAQAQTKTASGIFLPSAADKTQSEATVVSVGPGAKDKDGKIIEMSLKAGDRVLLPTYGGQSIKVGEDEFSIFRDSEIIAKIQE